MRLLLVVAALALLPSCSSAWAGESYLGTIYVWDGGSANNATTTVPDAGRDVDGGLITDGGATQVRWVSAGFVIPTQNKISLQDQTYDSLVGTGIPACTSTAKCLRLGRGQLLPSSTGSAANPVTVTSASTNLLSDGGINYVTSTYNGGLVSVAAVDGGCCVAEDVYLRNGNE